MMPTVRLDEDVFNGLKALAEPFTDTPNSVIRRLLEECGTLSKVESVALASSAVAQQGMNRGAQPRRRRTTGLIPQSTYEKYLLHVLATQFKGRGDKSEITKAVIRQIQSHEKFSAADLVHVSTGETRAENTIAWGRNALKERGLISLTSPRGTWELTERGLREGQALKL